MHTIQYLRQHTTIPLPNIRCWGLAEESPHQLGPFIIIDFIKGIRLSTFLKQPTENENADMILNPAIEDKKLDAIYDQLADYILQISRLEFSLIGAISQDVSGTWTVASRPLTYDMNELATGTGYPIAQLPTAHSVVQVTSSNQFRTSAFCIWRLSGTSLKTRRMFKGGSSLVISLSSLYQNTASMMLAHSKSSATICNLQAYSSTQTPFKSPPYLTSSLRIAC